MNVIKRFISAAAAVVTAVSMCGFAYAETLSDKYYDSSLPRVIDDADLITDSEERLLEEKINNLIQDLEVDCIIITMDDFRDYGYYEILRYAEDYYDDMGYGIGDDFDGIMYIISMGDRSYGISTMGFCREAITDEYGVGWIEDDVIELLSDGDYYESFDKFVDDVYDFVREARENKPYGFGNKKRTVGGIACIVSVSLLIAGLITLIVSSVLKNAMKSILPQPQAKQYLTYFDKTFSQDTFLYSNVTKVPIPQSSGSSGGHGSGGHGGHSGHF